MPPAVCALFLLWTFVVVTTCKWAVSGTHFALYGWSTNVRKYEENQRFQNFCKSSTNFLFGLAYTILLNNWLIILPVLCMPCTLWWDTHLLYQANVHKCTSKTAQIELLYCMLYVVDSQWSITGLLEKFTR